MSVINFEFFGLDGVTEVLEFVCNNIYFMAFSVTTASFNLYRMSSA